MARGALGRWATLWHSTSFLAALTLSQRYEREDNCHRSEHNQPAMASIALSIRPYASHLFPTHCPSCHRHASAFARKQIVSKPTKYKNKPRTAPSRKQLQHHEQQEPHASKALPPLPIALPIKQEITPTETYFVRRTPTRNLPIYQVAKRGGNLKETSVKKIDGQKGVLMQQLEEFLEPKPERLDINPINGHIVMKVCWIHHDAF